MANKRDLKKIINYICGNLFSECVAVSLYDNKKDEEITALVVSVLAMHSDYISRVSHPEPGMRPKAYFKDLREKFNAQVNEVIDNIANL